MTQSRGAVLLAVAVIAVAVAATRWPRLNDVETGRTPEYPDLTVREYAAGEAAVAKAAREAIDALPGWSFVGAGRGPGGSQIQARATATPLRLGSEVTIAIRREGGRTRLRVRSKSSFLPWDFGLNAAHVRDLQAGIDARLGRP